MSFVQKTTVQKCAALCCIYLSSAKLTETLLTTENQTLNMVLYHFAKYQLNVPKLNRLTKYCVLNERWNLVQKYSHTTQISWFLCWGILIWYILYIRWHLIMLTRYNYN